MFELMTKVIRLHLCCSKEKQLLDSYVEFYVFISEMGKIFPSVCV